jgi:purine-cytosine permease-like protein
MSTGVTSLYGTGLDFSSVFPRLNRVQASLFIGTLAFVFILVGRLAFDLLASVNAFIGAIVICTTPWMIIMMIGYWVRRGYYSPVDLQVFNQGRLGGRYWFSAGTNWRGMAAWIPAAVVGVLFANYPPLIEGPFRNAAGGVDLSLVVSIGLAAVIYLVLLFAVPEPRYVFGPAGPRLVPASDAPLPPVVDDPRASTHRVGRRRDLDPTSGAVS